MILVWFSVFLLISSSVISWVGKRSVFRIGRNTAKYSYIDPERDT